MRKSMGNWSRLFSKMRIGVAHFTSMWIALRENVRRGSRGHRRVEEFYTLVAERLPLYLQADANALLLATSAKAESEEHAMLAVIRAKTKQANRNNITRTDAYLRIYQEHTELHWALLAHLVSRNGGWNMTDLCGDAVRPVLTDVDAAYFFRFLERCNYLIFQDAYPQLLLYVESKHKGRPLYHLLPALGVSVFMRAVWDVHWLTREPKMLVCAQIINEQSYIEKRVVKHKEFAAIFQHPAFSAQSLFHLVSVIFPDLSPSGRLAHVYGNRVRDFTSITERVAVGKMLYAWLFQDHIQPVRGCLRFAERVVHTGSRADYLPAVFKRRTTEVVGRADKRQYSPELSAVWPDVEADSVEQGDWCQDLQAMNWLWPDPVPKGADLTETYIRQLGWMKQAAHALGPIVQGAQGMRKSKY